MTFRGYGIGNQGECWECSWCSKPIPDGEMVSAKIQLRGFPIDGDFDLECAAGIFEQELIEFGEGLQSLAVLPTLHAIAAE